MFGFNYVEGGAWNDDGIKAIARFFERVERLIERVCERAAEPQPSAGAADGKTEKELRYILASTLQRVTDDIERFMFNTAIARIMELVNAMYKYIDSCDAAHVPFLVDVTKQLVLILGPFAPHFAEEMNERLGVQKSVFQQSWPAYNPDDLVKDVVNIGVQVNGKIRARIDFRQDAGKEEIQNIALADEKVKAALGTMQVQKVIVIPGRLVNIVAK